MAKIMNVLLLLLFFILLPSTDAVYNVINYGAKSDGKTDSTKSFLSAWTAACAATSPATIVVPVGSYLLKQATFEGPCTSKITIQISGTLLAPSNYAVLGSSAHWLYFTGVQGVSIYGGTLDARGASLYACKAKSSSCPSGASSLTFNSAKDILISGLTSINSQLYHLVIEDSANVHIQAVKINAPSSSPNTDGIHVQQSIGVTITSTGIKTGDDCISIGPGTKNLWMEHVACGPGHGISIGSLGKGANEEGVQNVTAKTVVFTGSDNGLRIKTWGRASNGFVKGVVFQHAVMRNVENPIIIDQHYCPNNQNCPGKVSGVKISDVTYSDIQGTSASLIAVNFNCSSSNPCKGIGLQNIKLTYSSQSAKSSCNNVIGTASGVVVPPSCL